MPNSCISSVEITLKYFQVIDLASFFMKNRYRALSQLRGRKWAQKGVNSDRKSVKIDIHSVNATFRMKNFDLRLTCNRQYWSM